eukprot:13398648-Alexandrium_andersonii.AAC.1
MSASLVGSEMCIRDRSRTVGWLAWKTWLTFGPVKTKRSTSVRQRRSSICLLYTSDAADDSSV